MPIKDGVGFGRWTRIKLEHLRSIMAMHVSITQAVLNRNPYFRQVYHFIDATAGPGEYEVNGVEVRGSPLVFLSVAEIQQIRYEADLIEIEQVNVDSLKACIPELRFGKSVIHWSIVSFAMCP